MLVTIADRSFPFDGNTPCEIALPPGQKGVVELAEALAQAGHTVRVFNQCEMSTVVRDVSWVPLEEAAAASTDLCIAHQDPELLDLVPDIKTRVLWLTGSGKPLVKPERFAAAARHRPTLVYQGDAHLKTIPDALLAFEGARIRNGVGEAFLNAEEPRPAVSPRAVVTTHPLLGLEWLIGLWRRRIHGRLPWAELHVFSSALHGASEGRSPAPAYERIHAIVTAAEKSGVHVHKPLPDAEMVEFLRAARVHLYPSHETDVSAMTLAESQAVGLPAIARPLGAAGERILDGKTGFLAKDDNAFAEYAIRLLDDQATHARMSEHARERGGQSWSSVAEAFEALTR